MSRYDSPLPPEEMQTIAFLVVEAMSILTILKPLLKQANKLTPAQQRTVTNAVSEASILLSDACEVDSSFRYDRLIVGEQAVRKG